MRACCEPAASWRSPSPRGEVSKHRCLGSMCNVQDASWRGPRARDYQGIRAVADMVLISANWFLMTPVGYVIQAKSKPIEASVPCYCVCPTTVPSSIPVCMTSEAPSSMARPRQDGSNGQPLSVVSMASRSGAGLCDDQRLPARMLRLLCYLHHITSTDGDSTAAVFRAYARPWPD